MVDFFDEIAAPQKTEEDLSPVETLVEHQQQQEATAAPLTPHSPTEHHVVTVSELTPSSPSDLAEVPSLDPEHVFTIEEDDIEDQAKSKEEHHETPKEEAPVFAEEEVVVEDQAIVPEVVHVEDVFQAIIVNDEEAIPISGEEEQREMEDEVCHSPQQDKEADIQEATPSAPLEEATVIEPAVEEVVEDEAAPPDSLFSNDEPNPFDEILSSPPALTVDFLDTNTIPTAIVTASTPIEESTGPTDELFPSTEGGPELDDFLLPSSVATTAAAIVVAAPSTSAAPEFQPQQSVTKSPYESLTRATTATKNPYANLSAAPSSADFTPPARPPTTTNPWASVAPPLSPALPLSSPMLTRSTTSSPAIPQNVASANREMFSPPPLPPLPRPASRSLATAPITAPFQSPPSSQNYPLPPSQIMASTRPPLQQQSSNYPVPPPPMNPISRPPSRSYVPPPAPPAKTFSPPPPVPAVPPQHQRPQPLNAPAQPQDSYRALSPPQGLPLGLRTVATPPPVTVAATQPFYPPPVHTATPPPTHPLSQPQYNASSPYAPTSTSGVSSSTSPSSPPSPPSTAAVPLQTTASFPGPLFDPSSISASAKIKEEKKGNVLRWLDERVVEAEQALGFLRSKGKSGGKEEREEEGRVVLVKLVKVLVEGGGRLWGTPEIEQKVRDILIAPASLHLSASSLTTSNQIASSTSPAAIDQLQSLLLTGQKAAAVTYAMDEGLWSHALLISSCIDKSTWSAVVTRFVSATLPGDNRESLKVLYELFGGVTQPTTVFSEEGAVLPKPDVRKWKEALAIVYGNRGLGEGGEVAGVREKMLEIGKAGGSVGECCALLSCHPPPMEPSPSDPNTPPSGITPHLYGSTSSASTSMEDSIPSVLLTECIEYALSLTPPPVVPSTGGSMGRKPQQEIYLGVRHLQPYKLLRAWGLAESGEEALAKKYCDALNATVKLTAKTQRSAPYPTEFINKLKELSDRLAASSSGTGSVSWISRTVSKPSLETLGTWFEGRLTKLVDGDSSSSSATPSAPEYPSYYGTGTRSTTPNFGAGGRASSDGRRSGEIDGLSAYCAGASNGGGFEPYNNERRSTEETSWSGYANVNTINNGSAFSNISGYSAAGASLTPSYGNERKSIDDASNNSVNHLWSPYDSTSASPAFAEQSSYSEVGHTTPTPAVANGGGGNHRQEYDDLEIEDLGFGNSKPKQKKETENEGGADGDQEDDKDVKGKGKAKAQEPQAVDKSQELKSSQSSSWLGRLWSSKPATPASSTPPPAGPIKAKLGDESAFVYDKDLKRWINKKAGATESAPAPPPPPPGRRVASAAGMQPNRSSSPTPPMPPPRPASSAAFSAPPPPALPPSIPRTSSSIGVGRPSTVSTPPDSTSHNMDTTISASSSPPSSSPVPLPGPPDNRSASVPPPASKPPPGPPTGKPPGSLAGTSPLSRGPIVDPTADLLARAPPPRSKSSMALGGKKNIRSRYVDVFEQTPPAS